MLSKFQKNKCMIMRYLYLVLIFFSCDRMPYKPGGTNYKHVSSPTTTIQLNALADDQEIYVLGIFDLNYSFDINEGDNLELPDLVLNYTNSAFVVLTFKLPNGSIVRNTTVINNGSRIYFTGELIRDIHTGIYSDWKIKYNGKTYLADKFEITEETDKLEIWLREE